MAIFKRMKSSLKDLRHSRTKRKRPDNDTEKPTPNKEPGTESFSCSIGENIVVPESVTASVGQFDKVTSKGHLSKILLWMLAQDQIQNDAKFDENSTTASPKIMDEDQLTAWFRVSLCVESFKSPKQPKGLVRAAKELGLSWENDISWRIGRLILFYGSEFPAHAVIAPSEDQMEGSKDGCVSIMLADLRRLLLFVKALKPSDKGKNSQWRSLKDSLLRRIEQYTGCGTLDSLLTVPPCLRILLSSKSRWYYPLDGLCQESRKKSSSFLKHLASNDLVCDSSTTASEDGRPASNKVPTGSPNPVDGPEMGNSTDEVSWRRSTETKQSVSRETEDQRSQSSTVRELNARLEALERKSSPPLQAQLHNCHSCQQRENSHSSLLSSVSGGYYHAQQPVPVPHGVQQGVQQPQIVAASNHTPAPLPTENSMAAQPAPPQIERGREDWTGWGQRRDERSRIPRRVPSNPFFTHYGQADAHLPRVTDSPSVDPAHGGPFVPPATVPMAASPSMLSMQSMPLLNRCSDGHSGKPELAADFTARDRDLRPVNRLQISNDEVLRRRAEKQMNKQGIENSRVHDISNRCAPQYDQQDRPPTRQYAPHPGTPRRSATIRSGRSDMYSDMYSEYAADPYEQDYPPMRHHAPSPGMPRRRATIRGYRHDQDRDYGIFEERDHIITEPGYTVRPRPIRYVEYVDTRRRRRDEEDPWGYPPRDSWPGVVPMSVVQQHFSPAHGVHLMKPSKVTRLKRSKTLTE